jgi:hypothetical protein
VRDSKDIYHSPSIIKAPTNKESSARGGVRFGSVRVRVAGDMIRPDGQPGLDEGVIRSTSSVEGGGYVTMV